MAMMNRTLKTELFTQRVEYPIVTFLGRALAGNPTLITSANSDETSFNPEDPEIPIADYRGEVSRVIPQPLQYTLHMSDPFGLVYAVIVCALGGMTAQTVYRFFHPKLGMIWSGGVAAMIGFLFMVGIAVVTQILFGYPMTTT